MGLASMKIFIGPFGEDGLSTRTARAIVGERRWMLSDISVVLERFCGVVVVVSSGVEGRKGGMWMIW